MDIVSESAVMVKGHGDGTTRSKMILALLGMRDVNLSVPGLYGGRRGDKVRARLII